MRIEKRYLRSGMIVKLRNNSLYMVMINTGMEETNFSDKDVLLSIDTTGKFKSGWLRLSNYDNKLYFHTNEEDLEKCKDFYNKDMDKEFDIMEVYFCRECVYMGLINHYTLLRKV